MRAAAELDRDHLTVGFDDLVAAHAEAGAQRPGQAGGHRHQHFVAHGVAEAVVDGLEVVDVRQRNAERAAMPAGVPDRGFQVEVDLAAVRQARERVTRSQCCVLLQRSAKSRSQIADVARSRGKPDRADHDQRRTHGLGTKIQRTVVEAMSQQHRNGVARQHVRRHPRQLTRAQLEHAENEQNAVERRSDELHVASENLYHGDHCHAKAHLQCSERRVFESLVPAAGEGRQQSQVDQQEERSDLGQCWPREEGQLPAQSQHDQTESVGRRSHGEAAQPEGLTLFGRARFSTRRRSWGHGWCAGGDPVHAREGT